MAKLLAMVSGGVMFCSTFALQPGQPVSKAIIISAVICGASVYKVWLDETRAENSRRKRL